MTSWLAAPLTCAALGLGLWLHRRVRGWLPEDVPTGGRKAHDEAIPMVGAVLGLAVAITAAVTTGAWLGAAVLLAAAVGHLDDRRKEDQAGLGWPTKAAGLTVAAGLATLALGPGDAVSWCLCLCLLFVVTNAVNFLDNTDGVAVAVTTPALIVVAVADADATLAAITAAVLLGFAPWNWPRARLYLGDAGAYAIGLTLGAVVLAPAPALAGWASWLPLLAVPLLDFTQVIAARLVLGRAPWVGDRRHVSHVLQHAGLPRTIVAPLLAALATGLAVLAAPPA